jgi:uncharacterized protein
MPMTFFAAAIWSTSALVALDFLALLLISAHPASEIDLVSRVLCQAAAFVGTLFLLTLVHERERTLSDVLGLRRASIPLCVLSIVLGFTLQGPMNLLSEAIYKRYPLPEEQVELIKQLFDVPALHQKIALVLAAGVIGPVVEEMLFRGALFRGLRRGQPPALTVIGIALLFAAAHRDLRNFTPDFVGGLAMGYVRLVTGSLWPAIFVHATFNAVSAAYAIQAGPEADMFTRGQNIGAA